MEDINQQQALNILIKAAQVAQSKGAFTLDDAELVNKAIRTFIPKETTSELTKEETTEEEKTQAEAEA